MAAEDDEVLLEGKLVGYALGKDFPVRGHVNDLVVRALGLQIPDAVEHRFHHHHHAGVSAVGIVVHRLAAPQSVLPQIMDVNLCKALFDGPGRNGKTQRTFQQFRNHADDVYP